MSWPWSQLGLSGPSDLSQIRRAYAEKLKTTHPEDDPEGFQRLHSAYQLASRMARQSRKQEYPDPVSGASEQAPQPRERDEQDFTFDELLQSGEAPPRPAQEEEADFDFESLLREEGVQSRPRQEEKPQDWDYDRLFAEGEAERAKERRRRGEQRRNAQGREEQLQSGGYGPYGYPEREQGYWQSTEAILHTIEMMYHSRAETAAWEKFFQGSLFQQARNDTDLIFGLEDFVSTHPDLAWDVKAALFQAYGFEKGASRPELRPLYQMLLPAWRAKRNTSNQQWKSMLLGIAVALGLFVLMSVSRDSATFLGAVAVVGVFGVVLIFSSYKTQSRRIGKKKAGRRVVLGILLLGLTALVMTQGSELWKVVDRVRPVSDPRERVCRYLEQDFGGEFRSDYNKNAPESVSQRYDNVFSVEDDPAKQFMAGPDGERDLRNGHLGYTTNYPEMRMLWALKDFAGAHDITGVNNVDVNRGLERWETSGTFLITLPVYGAGETILELGELLNALSEERWYQVRTPECEVVLCSRRMREGRLILLHWKPADGAFNGPEVCALYKESFAHAYCAQLLKECELDRDFISGREGEAYTLTGGGMAEMKGEQCCLLYGLNESGSTAMEYYVNLKGTAVYCVPGDFWETGGTREQISFYRLIHWNDADRNPLGLISLFYPWLEKRS